MFCSLRYQLIWNLCFSFDCNFTYQCGQWFCYVREYLRDALNANNARPRTVDHPLMSIFRMRQGACCCGFCTWRLPTSHEWMSATNRNMNYPRFKAKNGWPYFDPHSQNGVVRVLLLLLPIKAANQSVIHNSDQITVQLPYLQDHKSLMLCWRLFWCIAYSTSCAIDNCFHHDLNVLAVFLMDWVSALWPRRAKYYACTVHSHTTKIYLSFQKIHSACYTSVYQPIFTSYCSPFPHNISLIGSLGRAI